MSASQTRVTAVLTAAGLAVELREFGESTRTSQEAADAIGCSVAEIAKSVILKAKVSDRHVLVVTSGVNRVCEKSVAALVGEKIGRADADFVRARTGFVIGGVAPLAHAEVPITLVDEDLLQFNDVWAAAGTPHSVFRIRPADLVTLTGGQVARVKEIRE
ncbi:YbaK/EbsC family protein [Chitinibacteraceae bacterium HSL-7]